MNSYKTYFDSQTISPEGEKRLLGLLDAPLKAKKRPRVKPIAAMAACCAILAASGLYGLRTGPLPLPRPFAVPDKQTEEPSKTDALQMGSQNLFMLPMIPAVEYPLSRYDGISADSARIYVEDGSFWVKLSQNEIAHLLGGEDSIPWFLYWDGFEASADALYDNQGSLLEISLWAKGEKDWAKVSISPEGAFSLDCAAGDQAAVTEVRGMKVSAYREEDEERTLYHSSYVKNGMEVRAVFCSFENNSFLSDIFISMCNINAGELMTNADIPKWASAKLTSFNEALEYGQFAPYLPEKEPVKGWEFEGSYSYQEGVRNRISLNWLKGYDNIHIAVALPEGEPEEVKTVDINVPASYDARLYEIPWCDSVPEEYQLDFHCPAFRAGDMSLKVVKARQVPHDTGGYSYNFKVLHKNGTLVSYSFDGVSSEDIWAAIAPSVK